jgi:hypothetical protein
VDGKYKEGHERKKRGKWSLFEAITFN